MKNKTLNIIIAFIGIFILNPATKNIAGEWIYSEERVLDGIYKMEIKEDSTFVYRVFSKKQTAEYYIKVR
jgi:hypothetical protein